MGAFGLPGEGEFKPGSRSSLSEADARFSDHQVPMREFLDGQLDIIETAPSPL